MHKYTTATLIALPLLLIGALILLNKDFAPLFAQSLLAAVVMTAIVAAASAIISKLADRQRADDSDDLILTNEQRLVLRLMSMRDCLDAASTCAKERFEVDLYEWTRSEIAHTDRLLERLSIDVDLIDFPGDIASDGE